MLCLHLALVLDGVVTRPGKRVGFFVGLALRRSCFGWGCRNFSFSFAAGSEGSLDSDRSLKLSPRLESY
jgi:hypothetical protein